MPTRALIAYAIIVAFALAGVGLLWVKVLRHRLAMRRGRIREERERRLRNATRQRVPKSS